MFRVPELGVKSIQKLRSQRFRSIFRQYRDNRVALSPARQLIPIFTRAENLRYRSIRCYAQSHGGGAAGGFPGLGMPQHQKGEALKEYVSYSHCRECVLV
jgi:hypothetical protein